MSNRTATVVEDPTGGSGPNITHLVEGWSAVGVSPGAADERLSGLDAEMLPFRAPGTAAAVLQSAGLWQVGTPRDLDEEDWWFRCRFAATPAADGEETRLRLEGLATIADVWLNGSHLLASDNMHIAHEIGIDELLRSENELVIGVKALSPLLAARRPRPRWRTRLVPSQGLRWVRTSLFGRIPAFAPGPAPVGPWRPVSLLRHRHVAMDDVVVRGDVDGSDGLLRVQAVLRPLGDFRPEVATVRLAGPTGLVEAPLAIEERSGGISIGGTVRVDDVPLWWPHTHGTPVLHDVTVVVSGTGQTLTIPLGRVGFRTLDAADEPGLAMSVNGEPLFCRGGALLPHAVTLDLPADELRSVLERFRAAGMNMIRLSGVGTYGSDELYALCDELGLLVWQDFAFASLDYPIDDHAFRSSVEREARGFLARAGGHPSLAVLCGNSEIEQQVGMLGLDPELGRGPLFGELLPGLVRELDVDAHYVTSSPTGGGLPFWPNAGVAHYFGVGAYRRPLDDARRAEVRFAAECLAFANVPEDGVLDALDDGGGGRLVHHPAWKTGVPRDSVTGWDFDDVRDHYLRELFGLEPVELRWDDPERYIQLSRIVTGEVMAATLGEWRRCASTCRGALLWTLNDVVPGAGWGILDYRGGPKAAYWYVRRALAPVAVWLTDEGNNGIAVHVANDTDAGLAGRLAVALERHDGQTVRVADVPFELPPRSQSAVAAEVVLGSFADASRAFRFGPPEHDVVTAELREHDRVRSRGVLFPQGPPLTGAASDDLGLAVHLAARPDGGTDVTVETRRLAYAVKLDAPGLETTDDYFTLPGGHTNLLTVRPAPSHNAAATITLRPLNGRPLHVDLRR